jgi:hypothetical protein
MPFIDEILKYKTLSIIGMEKNTGKTECLNYILKRIESINKNKSNSHIAVAITSIGIDGESIDQVSKTKKPEIFLAQNTVFVTTENFYRSKSLTSEILNLSQRKSSLGKLVTAKVITPGKVIISGPSTVAWLDQYLQEMKTLHIDLSIIDGALSRKSLGSPALTEAVILTTGASVSPYLPELLKKTRFLLQLMNLPLVDFSDDQIVDQLKYKDTGLYAISKDFKVMDIEIPSALLIHQYKENLFQYGYTFYIPGALTEQILKFLRIQKEIRKTTVIVKDFTKIFASQEVVQSFIKAGGQIQLLLKNKLIALCVNPTSPSGFTYNSEMLCDALSKEFQIPVYDIVKNKYK